MTASRSRSRKEMSAMKAASAPRAAPDGGGFAFNGGGGGVSGAAGGLLLLLLLLVLLRRRGGMDHERRTLPCLSSCLCLRVSGGTQRHPTLALCMCRGNWEVCVY